MATKESDHVVFFADTFDSSSICQFNYLLRKYCPYLNLKKGYYTWYP